MVQTSLVNRNAAVAFLMNHGANLSQIIGVFNALHRGARSHDADHQGLAELHHILHNRGAGGINTTLALCVLNAFKQLGARFVGEHFCAHQTAHAFVQNFRHRHKRAQDKINHAQQRQRGHD